MPTTGTRSRSWGFTSCRPSRPRRRRWVVRAFLPEAKAAWVVDLTRGEPGERVPMERIHPDGFFVARLPGTNGRFPYRLRVENHEGHSWEFVDPYLLRAGPHRFRSASCWARGRTTAITSGSVPTPDTRGVSRGPFRRLGSQCAAGQRHRQFQSLGRPAPPHGQSRRHGDLGDLHPRPLPGRGLQVRGQEPPQRLSRPEVRSLRLRRRASAQDGLGRLGRHPVLLARPGMARQPRQSARASTSRSRSTRFTWAHGNGASSTATRFSTIASSPTSSSLTSTTPTSRTSS